MLDPRAIATLGIGYAPAVVARLGLWPVDVESPSVTIPIGGGRWRRADRQRPAAIVYRPLALQARGATLARAAVTAETLLQIAATGRSTAALSVTAETPIRGAAIGASRARVTLRTEIDPAITVEEVAMVIAWMARH